MGPGDPGAELSHLGPASRVRGPAPARAFFDALLDPHPAVVDDLRSRLSRCSMSDSPSTTGRKLLGEILVQAGVLTPDRLDDGLKYQKEARLRLGESLIRLGSEREVKAQHLMRQEPKDYVVQPGDILHIRFSV